MLLVEIAKSAHRLRTWVFAGGLAALAVLPVVVQATSRGAGGPPFFDQIRHNGLFGALAAVALIQPFFLPVGTGLLSGEAIAAEASGGTLRYLLVQPVGRVRLVLSKYAAVMVQIAAAVGWVILFGTVAGGIAFGFGRFPTLSGPTIGWGAAFLRVLLAGGYVVAGVTGLAAIGVFLSTITDSAPGAAVATVILAIVSQILDGLSSLRVIHPYLFSHQWLAFADLFRSPVSWDAMRHGLILDGAYTAIFLVAGAWLFRRKDVAS